MIRKMTQDDWPRVAEIYRQGIESGVATFTADCPSYTEWDAAHLPDCRLVYEAGGKVLGWAAVSPTSHREVYRGVVEESIYVDAAHRGEGIGEALISALKSQAAACGFWSLFAVILSVNGESIAFHKKCGFREIGYKERVARDRFGIWQNTTLMEYRLPEDS